MIKDSNFEGNSGRDGYATVVNPRESMFLLIRSINNFDVESV